MNFFTKIFRSRDKPMNHLGGLSFLFGQTAAGKTVNEWTAMQTTEGGCIRIRTKSRGRNRFLSMPTKSGEKSACWTPTVFPTPRSA